MRELEVCGRVGSDRARIRRHGSCVLQRVFASGNKLVWTERGAAKYLTCCFHGWSYDLEGNLRGVLDEGEFRNLEKGKLGLTPIACGGLEGLYLHQLPVGA